MAPMNGVYARVHSVPSHLSHAGYAALPGSPTSAPALAAYAALVLARAAPRGFAWMALTDGAWS